MLTLVQIRNLSITHTIRVLPSLSTTDTVTVPSLFKLVGVAIFPKSISVFFIVVVRVLLSFLFITTTTVSAVYVAVMIICDQVMRKRFSIAYTQLLEQFPIGAVVTVGAGEDAAVLFGEKAGNVSGKILYDRGGVLQHTLRSC